jgi:hypothetical protein
MSSIETVLWLGGLAGLIIETIVCCHYIRKR